jgi:DNA-binding transcriptional MerR regulator
MFRIGEFSNIARVSKRLLHYYDEIGLLKPERVDQHTGYRFYSAAQLPRLNRILALKEVGLSLEQIAEMLRADVSDEAIRGMLLRKRAELEQTLRDDLRRLQQLEARLRQNQSAEAGPDVVLRAIPAQLFLAVRAVVPKPAAMLRLAEEVQRVVSECVDQRALGPLTGVVYTDGFTLDDNDVALGYLLKRPVEAVIALSEERELRVQELPAVPTMATAVQVGGPDMVFLALGQIGRWIEDNGYRIAGPYREISLTLPAADSPEDMVVEVQMPIEAI